MIFALKDLARESLRYLDLPAEDADIAAGGQSAAEYLRAKSYANLAAQELADFAPWPWLAVNFLTVPLAIGQYLADMPADCRRLLSNPSHADLVATIFDPVTMQQIQELRSGTFTNGIPGFMALTYSSTPAAWAAGTYAVGQSVMPTVANGFRYQCTVVGASGSTEPSWPLVVGAVVVDGAAQWVCQPALRIQLVVHPPSDEARNLIVAYSRSLPAMAADTDIPQIPEDLHRIVLTGTYAYCEELIERNWGGGARQAFVQEIQAAWLRAAPSSSNAVSLRGCGRFGALRFGQQLVPQQWRPPATPMP